MLMAKLNQKGALSGVSLSFGITVFLLIGTIIVAGWSYSKMSDYKNNSDKKSAVAVAAAVKAADAQKDKQFAEDYKNPLQAYTGPDAYGSIDMLYPKTWSAYVDDSGSANTPIDAYFAPNVVPSFNDQASLYALRVQVLNQSYDSVLNQYTTLQKNGKVKITAYALPKMPKTIGARIVGEETDGTPVDKVVLPLRAQTVVLWTEGGQSNSDFNTYILPNFSFSP